MPRTPLRPILAAAVLSPLAATCTTPTSLLAEAHQLTQNSTEDKLIAFLIDGGAPPRRGLAADRLLIPGTAGAD